MYILYSQRAVYLFHTCLAGSLFCDCDKKFKCVLHEIAFLFCSGAWIEAVKAALSVLPAVTGEVGHGFHHFRPLHLCPVACESGCVLTLLQCAFCASPVLCDGSCPVAPEQMCLCNSPVSSPRAWMMTYRCERGVLQSRGPASLTVRMLY